MNILKNFLKKLKNERTKTSVSGREDWLEAFTGLIKKEFITQDDIVILSKSLRRVQQVTRCHDDHISSHLRETTQAPKTLYTIRGTIVRF